MADDLPPSRAARILLGIVGGFAATLHRSAGALCLLVPPSTALGALALVAALDEGNAADLAVFVVLAAGLILFTLSLAVWLAGRAHERRLDRDHNEFGIRLEMVRDWHMRGDIDEAQYSRFLQTLDPLRQGKAASSRFRQVGGQAMALGLGLLLAVPGLAFLIVSATDEVACGSGPCPEWDAAVAGSMATLAVVAVAVTVSFVAAGVLVPLAQRHRRDQLRRLDDMTEEALARARATRGKAPQRA